MTEESTPQMSYVELLGTLIHEIKKYSPLLSFREPEAYYPLGLESLERQRKVEFYISRDRLFIPFLWLSRHQTVTFINIAHVYSARIVDKDDLFNALSRVPSILRDCLTKELNRLTDGWKWYEYFIPFLDSPIYFPHSKSNQIKDVCQYLFDLLSIPNSKMEHRAKRSFIIYENIIFLTVSETFSENTVAISTLNKQDFILSCKEELSIREFLSYSLHIIYDSFNIPNSISEKISLMEKLYTIFVEAFESKS